MRSALYVDGVVTEKYLWQGRTQLLAVYNADGSLKSRFLYADARMPVAMETGGQTYYLAHDQVGSLRAVIDANGTVVKTVTYDSFGNMLNDSNENFTVPFGFAGGLYDADAGLVRFGFRDYDAEVGRWTAKDPIGFGGGVSDLYGYCVDDPISWIELEGLQGAVVSAGGIPLFIPPGSVFEPGSEANKDFTQSALELLKFFDPRPLANALYRPFRDDKPCPLLNRKKYKKTPNPNRRKGAEE